MTLGRYIGGFLNNDNAPQQALGETFSISPSWSATLLAGGATLPHTLGPISRNGSSIPAQQDAETNLIDRRMIRGKLGRLWSE